MDLVDVMRTAGNCRELRPEPVAHEIIYRVLDSAADTGGPASHHYHRHGY
jgi:hypothetical protein